MENEVEIKAAVVIQRAWRRHIDVHVYKYYRDLINFKARGTPSDLLKCVNPNEAKLLDAASGVTVRFRLAGERFPPNIYYKIFTNRPIQDLCANSPKDYTNVLNKQLSVKDTHSHIRIQKVPQDDKKGWYRRNENNGWRLLTDRLVHHLSSDCVTLETSKRMYKFDHNMLQRKKDVERRKKQRKVEWMQKMYKEGTLKARTDDSEMVDLVESAVQGIIATVESQGTDALEDWEVDELLNWTTGLNFDEYRETWSELATSSPSQKIVEDRARISSYMADSHELTSSIGFSNHTSASTLT